MLAKTKLLLVVCVGVLGMGCTSKASVSTDFDSGVDFSGYETFSFISDKPLLVADIAGVNPLLQGRLMAATRRELGAKGFRFVDDRERADFVVSFTVGARDKLRVTNYPADYRGAYDGGWGANYRGEVDVRDYTEGTIAIDVFDRAKRNPVWHGWAVKSITSRDRDNAEPLTNRIVGAILAEFPPGVGR